MKERGTERYKQTKVKGDREFERACLARVSVGFTARWLQGSRKGTISAFLLREGWPRSTFHAENPAETLAAGARVDNLCHLHKINV